MPDYKFSFSAVGETRKGANHKNNEDNFLIGSHYKKECNADRDSFEFTATNRCRYSLFAVFDGMGGGPYGEYASLYAAEEFYNVHMKLNDKLSPERVSNLISDAFQTANNRIVRSPYMVLGTTAAVCVLDREKESVRFFWSGDSRGYLYRDKILFQMTEDQSKAALSVKNGLYSKRDPQYKLDLNILTAYVGMDTYGYEFHPLKTAWITLKQDDMIFLMTDGISSVCSNYAIRAVIQKNTELFATVPLLYSASSSGSQDDLSVIQIKIY